MIMIMSRCTVPTWTCNLLKRERSCSKWVQFRVITVMMTAIMIRNKEMDINNQDIRTLREKIQCHYLITGAAWEQCRQWIQAEGGGSRNRWRRFSSWSPWSLWSLTWSIDHSQTPEQLSSRTRHSLSSHDNSFPSPYRRTRLSTTGVRISGNLP